MSDPVGRGGDALARGGWDEARACFEQALERSASAEAWDGLAWACWWLEDGAAARQWRRGGCGARGGSSTASSPSPEHGWLAALEAEMALAAGDTATAARLGSQVRELGRDLGFTDLEMLGLATEGLALVTEGEVEQGTRCLDEATAAALGGEYEELVGVGCTCCHLIVGPPKTRPAAAPSDYPPCRGRGVGRPPGNAGPPDAFVFTAPKGGPLWVIALRARIWRPATRNAGLDGLRIHDLRHTAVALWIAAGANPKEVAALRDRLDAIYTAGQRDQDAAVVDLFQERSRPQRHPRTRGTPPALADNGSDLHGAAHR